MKLAILILLTLAASNFAQAQIACGESNYWEDAYQKAHDDQKNPDNVAHSVTDAEALKLLPQVLNFAAKNNRAICLPKDVRLAKHLTGFIVGYSTQTPKTDQEALENFDERVKNINGALEKIRAFNKQADRDVEVKSAFKLFALAAKKDPRVKLLCANHVMGKYNDTFVRCEAVLNDRLDVYTTRKIESVLMFVPMKDGEKLEPSVYEITYDEHISDSRNHGCGCTE